jgi:phenylpropionate dioxygenase-like ring-hydroxylating dioxygenase large terminal subunit
MGTGNRRRFRCPYHAWTYDDQGALVAILREDTFGDIAREEYGLRALPTEERAGLVFAVLTPGGPMDLGAWLGGFGPLIDSLGLQDWHFYRRTEFPGPNWKLSYDGYLEGYHFQTLHKLTFGTNNITNLMVADAWGPHQRVGFATKKLPGLRDIPEAEWHVPDALAPIHTLFPNTSIAGAWQDHVMITQVLPGVAPEEHTCVQIIITRRPVETDADRRLADAFADMMYRGTKEEDYVVAFGAQTTLASGANTHLTLGRNEIALQHQHTWLARLTGKEDV